MQIDFLGIYFMLNDWKSQIGGQNDEMYYFRAAWKILSNASVNPSCVS